MNNINNFTNAHQDLIAWVVVILLVFLIKICRNILDNFQLQKLVLILLVGYTVAIICKLLIFRSERFEVIIPGLSEPPVRTLRATIPENESHIFR